jgi:hypothetical protein
MARHYAPMKEAYLHNSKNPTDKDDNFKRAWIWSGTSLRGARMSGRKNQGSVDSNKTL